MLRNTHASYNRLNANYATYPDGNVPRQGLYMSYRRVCDQYNIPHINTATLGKAIRLCFPTIKTRRLGVRGNSKYHCAHTKTSSSVSSLLTLDLDCGIRPSTQQEAEWLQDYVRKSNNNKNQDAARASGKSGDEGGSDAEDDDESSEGGNGGGPGPASVSKRNSLTIHNAKGIAIDPSDKTPTAKSILSSATQPPRPATGAFANTRIRRSVGPETGLGPTPHPTVPTAAPPAYLSHRNVSVRNLPNFPSIDEAVGASSTTPHGLAAREVWGWFETHLDQLLDSVRTHRFDQFEIHIRTFWQNLTGEYREVVHAPAIAGLMAKADAILYDVRGLLVLITRSVLTNHAGGLGDPALADAAAHTTAVAHQPTSASGQDGEDSDVRARELRQHLRRAQGRAWRPVWSSRVYVPFRFCSRPGVLSHNVPRGQCGASISSRSHKRSTQS